MRAAVVHRYGPPSVAGIETLPDPVPGAGEVLIRVQAASVNSGDARIRAARFPRGFGLLGRLGLGLHGPRRKVLGAAVAGTVSALGPGASGLAVGDQVCAMTGTRMGGHAELVAVPATQVVPVRAAVSLPDAAAVLFGGTTALYYVRDLGQVRAGERVLVIGASGAIGTIAVQLAAAAGAHVTAVTSRRNAALVRELGAADVVDSSLIADLAGHFDVVLDAVGVLTAQSGRRLLTRDGRLLLPVASLADLLRARGQVRAGSAPERPDDIRTLLGLVADGSLRVVIEATLPLEQIADAHARVDSGRKVGALLVTP